jgi:hypothetical protein
VQGIIQLQHAVASGERARSAVLTYAPFHLDRNPTNSSRLRAHRTLIPFHNRDIRHAKASLDANGRLKTELVRFDVVDSARDPDEGEMTAVTKALFKEAWELCLQSGITPVVALLTGDLSDPVVECCQQIEASSSLHENRYIRSNAQQPSPRLAPESKKKPRLGNDVDLIFRSLEHP